MTSDSNSPPYHDTASGLENSPRVSEDLPAQPTIGPEVAADEIDLSPPYTTPAPFRSKLRPRINTFPNRDVTLMEVKQRASQVRLERNLKKASPPVNGVAPVSSESLTCDVAGQRLTSPTSQSRLWSTSTQFSVTVSTSPSSSSFYIQPGTMEGSNANTGDFAPRATANTPSTGNSTATGNTVRFSHPAPPPHQSSQPPSNGGAAPSTDGAGCGSNPPPYSDWVIRLHNSFGSKDKTKWTSLANTAILRAKAHVLPWKGRRVLPQAAEDIWLRGDKILDDLLDILPHCDGELRDMVELYLDLAAPICADMLEQCERMPQRTPPPPQPATRSSSEISNPELRVTTQVSDTTLQGQSADTMRVPATNTDLPCDVSTNNHPDILVPAMHGLQATAPDAANTGDAHQPTTGSSVFNMRAMPRVRDSWPERPCSTARVQHGSPTNAYPAPQSSTSDATILPAPTAVTPVMHTAVSGSAPGSTSGSATGSASGSAPGFISGSAPGSVSGSASGSASTTPHVCMSSFTPAPAEKTIPQCNNSSTKMGDKHHHPPLRLHDATLRALTSTRCLAEEDSTSFQLHGFDPSGAVLHTAAAPQTPSLKPIHPDRNMVREIPLLTIAMRAVRPVTCLAPSHMPRPRRVRRIRAHHDFALPPSANSSSS
jgi:hypothetical protein